MDCVFSGECIHMRFMNMGRVCTEQGICAKSSSRQGYDCITSGLGDYVHVLWLNHIQIRNCI